METKIGKILNEMSVEKQVEILSQQEGSANKLINFGVAPEILQEFGVPKKDMKMSFKKYMCSIGLEKVNNRSHCVPIEVMLNLKSYLANPSMILYPKDSKYVSNRYVVVLDAQDNKGDNIIAIIDYDWSGSRITIINSVYGKGNIDRFIEQSDIAYKRTDNSASSGSNSQKESVISSNNIINYNSENFNPYIKNYEHESKIKTKVAAMQSNKPTAPLGENSPVSVAPCGQPNNIIKNNSENFNPYIKNYEQLGEDKTMNELDSNKVYYHGSNAKFTTFDKSKIKENKLGLAFNFTDDIGMAYQYGDNIMKVHLDLNNPLTLDMWDEEFPYEWFNKFAKLFTGEDDYEYDKEDYAKRPYTFGKFYNTYGNKPEGIQILEEMGYDGIAIPEDHHYGVFEPEQIHIIQEENKSMTKIGKILSYLDEQKNVTSLDKYTAVINNFEKIAKDELSKNNEATNDGGISRKELAKITGLDLEEETNEDLTPGQKSLAWESYQDKIKKYRNNK